jgi:hypothetical protein
VTGLFVVGDTQGYLDGLRGALQQAGLIDASDAWTGADATLVVLGDLVDRGPDSIGVVDFLMQLQANAAEHAGRVKVVLGNHEVLLLAAHRFGDSASGGPAGTFVGDWLRNGGTDGDLAQLSGARLGWLQWLPAMLLEQDNLLVHADAGLYLDYGSSIDAVNASFSTILLSDDVEAWTRLLGAFIRHRAFLAADGGALLERFFATYGGSRLVHGHTPIMRITGQAPETVTAPLSYHQGRCLDVDPGLYLGGPGFCFRLSEGSPQAAASG